MQMPTHFDSGYSARRKGLRTTLALSLPVCTAVISILSVVGCGGSGATPAGASPTPTATPTATPTPIPTPVPTPTPTPAATVLTIVPGTVTVSVGNTQAFTANVSGEPGVSQAVTWSVEESSGGGTITPNGLYTAPAVPGTYHIIAASQADSSRTAAAIVIVQAGSAVGSIQ
ncbi:MAG: hypothetical protein V4671_25390 [Armatimonadota bacterium]